ncbi:MAG: ATP-binding protein, partial [Bacteroidales bacterium]|nr:ATP-binding protein [Bacteroidales bacterium]
SNVYSWRSKTVAKNERGAQIDMLIDRKDHVITLCEMKFSKRRFAIDADYDEVLLNKVERFRTETRTPKAIHIALITSVGLLQNEYYDDVQNVVEMNYLFNK